MSKHSMQNSGTIQRHEDSTMGLPVILLNSAVETTVAGARGVVVPDAKSLETAMAVARVTLPFKLSGSEIKFLRKAIGEKAIDLAKYLDVTPETLSRWENGHDVISKNPERILRFRVVAALRDKVGDGVDVDVNKILNMEFSPFRMSPGAVTLVFERVAVLIRGNIVPVWRFCGTEEGDAQERKRA